MDYFIKMYKKKKGKDIRKDNRAVQKLRREVEKAKRALSTQHQARIEIESFFDGEDFSETLTRARFENENMVGIFLLSFSLIDTCIWIMFLEKILVSKKKIMDRSSVAVVGHFLISKIKNIFSVFYNRISL